MKSSVSFSILFTISVLGSPVPQSFALPQNLYTSAFLWASNVGHVTQFLDEAENIPAENLADRIAEALAFEKEQTMFKDSIDDVLGGDSFIQAANKTLVADGGLQSVIDLLRGMTQSDDTSVAVRLINSLRCTRILPAIDVYFNVVSRMEPGNTPLVAARPEGCFPK